MHKFVVSLACVCFILSYFIFLHLHFKGSKYLKMGKFGLLGIICLTLLTTSRHQFIRGLIYCLLYSILFPTGSSWDEPVFRCLSDLYHAFLDSSWAPNIPLRNWKAYFMQKREKRHFTNGKDGGTRLLICNTSLWQNVQAQFFA